MTNLIYLDHAATTPLRPEAWAAMEPFLTENFANPSSVYRLAQTARSAVDEARDVMAESLVCEPRELIFTSGGTEGNNAAIKGVAFARAPTGRHIVTTAIEHHAVLHPVEALTERFGCQSTVVPVGRSGIVDPAQVRRAMRPDTILLSVMWANNEIGTIQPVAELAQLAHECGALFHVDAVQAAGTLPISLRDIPIDLLTISAHKFYGPKGAGALFLRNNTPWWPLLSGGEQERNRRAGTENVAAIVGMARALTLACNEQPRSMPYLRGLRDMLLHAITDRVPDARINGDLEQRLPHNLNLSFPGVHGESLLVGLDLAGIMASSGSACASGSTEPSHVLRAIGLPDELAASSLRLTVGKGNTPAEIETAASVVASLVERLRALAPTPRSA